MDLTYAKGIMHSLSFFVSVYQNHFTRRNILIISSSSIGMDSARTYTSVSKEASYQGKVTTQTFMDSLNNSYLGNRLNDTLNEVSVSKEEESDTSEAAKDSFDNIFERMKTQAVNGTLEERIQEDYRNKIIAQCIQYLLALLLHQDISDKSLSPISSANGSSSDISNTAASGEYSIGFTSVESTYISYQHEEETTSFSTNGTVITKDGQEISFNLDLTMSRSFSSYYRESITASAGYIDPLVINLDCQSADVSDVKISFDLDSDGTMDKISVLSKGSGYLALDKNGDGIINDGSELFGTKSGDGFADLSQYDSDNNGWIDENDDVFDKLKICVMDEDGSQTIYKLKDKGLGGIYLGSSDTEFSLNSLDTNRSNAKIRKTGIFLYENGGVGTIQHLDLAQ